jgi:hypothetical protein
VQVPPKRGQSEGVLNPLSISPQIHNIIHAAIIDPELDNMPTDSAGGLNFKIVKSTKGNYADYSTSAFSRKPTDLSEEQLSAILEHGLYDLSKEVPAKPDAETIQDYWDMFQASLNGEEFDDFKYKMYR